MPFNEDEAREFQELVHAECHVLLPLDVAGIRARQLIALYRTLMGQLPEDQGVRTSSGKL